jgi:hypothetical protein
MAKFTPKTHDGKVPAKAFITNNKIHSFKDEGEWVAWHGSSDIAKFMAKHDVDPCGYGKSKMQAILALCETHKIKGRENIQW